MSLQICKVGSSDTVVDNRETDVTSSRRKIAMGARDLLAAAGGQLSWVDRHRPSRSADLPVHHSKVRSSRSLAMLAIQCIFTEKFPFQVKAVRFVACLCVCVAYVVTLDRHIGS